MALTLFPVVCCCVLLGPTAQYCQPLGADPRCALPKPVPICNVANPLGGNPSGVRGGSRHFGRASEKTHQQKTKRRFPRKTERAKKNRKIRNVRIFRKMKCGRKNARQLQTCFPQKLKRTKTENTERPHFPNFQKRLRFRFLAGRKRKRPHPAPRGAGRETQRRLRKCKLEEGWTGEGRWAHAKRKHKKGNTQSLKINHGGKIKNLKILFFYESCQPPLCQPRLRSSEFFQAVLCARIARRFLCENCPGGVLIFSSPGKS